MAIIKETSFEFEEAYSWQDVRDDDGVRYTRRLEVHGIPKWEYNSNADKKRRTTASGTWHTHPEFMSTHDDIPCRLTSKYLDADAWVYQGRVYISEDRDLTAEDVRALVNVARNKRRLTLDKAHALQAMSDQLDEPRRRRTIPQEVRVAVWQRDGGRCVDCDSQDKLEFDHVIPIALGGANTERNLQLLCETCNRRKGASLG